MRILATLFTGFAALASNAADVVHPPGTPLGSRTPEQLTVLWWQWAMSVPGEGSPVNDPTGARCGAGQDGDVWFLAGSFKSTKVRRACTVPAGKALFFPIVQKGDRSRTCDQARAGATLKNVEALDLYAEIDGKAVESPKRYRVSTQGCFDVYGKVSPMLGKAEPHPSASDGFWLLVAPLGPGRHTLRFGSRYASVIPDAERMSQDVEYVLQVE
ncbi:hypothetical protein BWI17_18720 [Betaproteobacteria bacterium GR16-43]|nr:hypothetical protein BWI17_18720 [Betaproteobacteria bacterium GR16-43]